MQLVKINKGRCELGKCKRPAVYSIRIERIGIKSKIDICLDCLNQLYSVLGQAVVPKSIETIKKPQDEYLIGKNFLLKGEGS